MLVDWNSSEAGVGEEGWLLVSSFNRGQYTGSQVHQTGLAKCISKCQTIEVIHFAGIKQ